MRLIQFLSVPINTHPNQPLTSPPPNLLSLFPSCPPHQPHQPLPHPQTIQKLHRPLNPLPTPIHPKNKYIFPLINSLLPLIHYIISKNSLTSSPYYNLIANFAFSVFFCCYRETGHYAVELVGVGEKAGFVGGAVIHLPFEYISFQPSADLRQLLISSAESERRYAVI
jgi:hypothetical protein